jgi:DNA-binding NtrC family response regulator
VTGAGHGFHVLVVDDDAAVRLSLSRMFGSLGFRVGAAEHGLEGLAYLKDHAPDVALLDMQMPMMDGMEVLASAKKAGVATEIIMMTGNAGVDTAVEAVRAGAYYFLTKPFLSIEAVAIVVEQAAQRRRLVDRTQALEQQLEAQERFAGLIGTSPRMLEVYRLIDGVASATSTVLVTGETGTGKELVARVIHQRSGSSAGPMVSINCAAIPKELVESELFGHVRGAFTGAQSARAGLFETAHGGTLFLDEVGDLPLAAQVKLLRVLQEGEVKRVGADEVKTVDVRVVSATNVDLKAGIAAGSFRSDLYYRLNVIAINLPPLRERDDDVQLLAHHFLQKYARRMSRPPKVLAPDALAALRGYAWPGNVRELEHVMERALVLAAGPVIARADLPPEVQGSNGRRSETSSPSQASRASSGGALGDADYAHLSYAEAKRVAMAQFEDAYVAKLLDRTGGNMSEAARQAGVDRSNFRRLMRRNKMSMKGDY